MQAAAMPVSATGTGSPRHQQQEAQDSSAAHSSPDRSGGLAGQQQQLQQAAALSAIQEDDKDSEDETAMQEQAYAEDEERKQIGGGLLKQCPIKTGYLLKKGERRKTWKKRYFVLRPDRLCYYKDDREYQILQHIAVSEVHACCQVEVKKHENSFGIVTPQRTFYVKADTPDEADTWVKQINKARKNIEKHKSSIAASLGAAAPTTPGVPGSSAAGGIERPRQDTARTTSGSDPLPPLTSYSTSRPIPIRQSASGTSNAIYGGSTGQSQSYTDNSLFSTSESSNTFDNYLSSSYASNSSAQSGLRPNNALPDMFPIDRERQSESEDLYDDRAAPPRSSRQYLATPVDRTRGAMSSSEEDDEPEDGRGGSHAAQTTGSLKSRLNPERVVVSGYLMKQGKRKNWRKRWFVLTSDKLMYARSHMDTKAHRCIALESILDAIEVVSKEAASETGELGPSTSGKKAPQNSFKIITPKRTYVVCAPSEEDEIKWISSIRVLLSAHRDSPGIPGEATPTDPEPPAQAKQAGLAVPATSPLASEAAVAAPARYKPPPPASPSRYCSIESQLEQATGRLTHLST